MAKSKLTETKKITHKLASEGVKNLIELLKNFSGKYVKFSFTEEEVEDVIEEDAEDQEDEE